MTDWAPALVRKGLQNYYWGPVTNGTYAELLAKWPAGNPVLPTETELLAELDTENLTGAKAKRIDAVKALLTTKIAAGRLHNTKTYQIDANARENFLGVAAMFGMAALNPHGGTWRDLANTEVQLNDVEMRALLTSVFNYLRDLRRALTAHIVAIRALTTVAAVNAYDITTGWPANT